MKQIILSVLNEGKLSPYLNDFIKICHKISIASFNMSKYKKFILAKVGISTVDFAYMLLLIYLKKPKVNIFILKIILKNYPKILPKNFFKQN